MTMYRGNPQRTGVLPSASLDQPKGELWRFRAQDALQSCPVVANGVVYVGSHDKHLYAVDLATGALRWQFATGGRVVSPALVHDGRVYCGSEDCNLYCLDAATGHEYWQYLTHGWVDDSPLYADGLILTTSSDHRLYALDAATGALRWSADTKSSRVHSPAVDGNEVFVTSFNLLIALKLPGGRPSWRYLARSSAGITTPPVVGPETVYFGTTYGAIWAIDRQRHTIRWTYHTRSRIMGALVLDGNRLYAGSRDFNVYCLDAATGALVWQTDTGDEVEASPVIAGDVLYYDTGGFAEPQLHAVNKHTGQALWHHAEMSDILTTTVHNGLVIYTTDDGDLVALH